MGDLEIVIKSIREHQSKSLEKSDAKHLRLLQELGKFDDIEIFHILRGNNEESR
jgi:hypothetical protein